MSNVCPVCGSQIYGGGLCFQCGTGEPLVGKGNDRGTRPVTVQYKDSFPIREGELFAGRYRIVDEIGRGGMGRVFLARDLKLDIDVAIKFIRPEYLEDEHMLRRFKNEILLAREVSHENVVRIYDFAEHEGLKFITMQYIAGSTLETFLNRSGPLQEREMVKVAVQICHGLEAARKKGIAHRDLKPQNILVDRIGGVYIADFGLARTMEQKELSTSGIILGTPEYIAPEQWRGERGDFRSDIYSMGILLYEMATARPLFQADTDLGYLHKHLKETPRFEAKDRAKISSYMRKIILRCLEKDPGARYQSAADVEADLLMQQATKAPLTNVLARLFQKGKKTFLLLFLLGIVLWFASQALSLYHAQKGSNRHRIAVLPFLNHTGEDRYDYWCGTLADLLTTDLGQSRYLQMVTHDEVMPFARFGEDKTNLSVPDPELLHDLYRVTGADSVLWGSFGRKEDSFQLSMNLISLPSGKKVDWFSTEGLGEESFFSMIDQMTDRTKASLKLPREVILRDFDKDIRLVTTDSLEALKLYSAAKELFREGRIQESVSEYQKAIAIDENFALAYAEMANAMGNFFDSRRRHFFEKALSLRERLSHRERLNLEGRFLLSFKAQYVSSLGIYQKLLSEFPDDREALEATATLHKKMENWTAARKAYRDLERLSPGALLIWANLFALELKTGHLSAAGELLARHKNEFQRAGRYTLFRFYLLFAQRNMESAERELKQLFAATPDPVRFSELYSDLCLVDDRLEDAEAFCRNAFEKSQEVEEKSITGIRYNNVSLHLGRMDAVLERLDSLIEEAQKTQDIFLQRCLEIHLLELQTLAFNKKMREEAQLRLRILRKRQPVEKELEFHLYELYMLGRMLVEDQKKDELLTVIEQMEEICRELGQPKRRFPLHLRSEWALLNGKTDESSRFFHEARSLFPWPERPEGSAGEFMNIQIADFMHTLGKIETQKGHPAEAVKVYEHIINDDIGRLSNAASWVMAHVKLARLYDRLGMKSRASDLARQVVGWWGGGDLAPEIVGEMKTLCDLP